MEFGIEKSSMLIMKRGKHYGRNRTAKSGKTQNVRRE